MAYTFSYFLLLLVVPLSFSINNTLGVFSTGIMNPLTMVFFRWFGVVLIMVPFMAVPLWRSWHVIIKHWKLFLVASFFGMIGCAVGVYVGGQYTSAMNISLLYSLAPIFTLTIECIFYAKRLSAVNMLGIFMAFIGVIFIITKGDFGMLFALKFSVGDLWGVFASFSWGLYAVLVRKQQLFISGWQLFTINAVFGMILAFPLFLYEIGVQHKPIVWTAEFFIIWGVLTIVSSLIAYLSVVHVIKRLGVTVSVFPSYIAPIYVVIIAIVFLGDTLQLYHVFSGVVILSGVFLALKKDKAI